MTFRATVIINLASLVAVALLLPAEIPAAQDTEPPELIGARSLKGYEVIRLEFNDPVGPSAEVLGNYRITLDTVFPEEVMCDPYQWAYPDAVTRISSRSPTSLFPTPHQATARRTAPSTG